MSGLMALCCGLWTGHASLHAALPQVAVVATDNYASEFSPPSITNTGLFTFTRNGDVSGPLTVRFSLGGTATPLEDYQDLSNSVTFPVDASTVTLPVEAIYSRAMEPTESVVLTLLPDASHELTEAHTATVYIWKRDYNDPAPPIVVMFTDGSGGEHVYPGGFINTVSFSVYRSGPTNLPLTVEYSIGGTAVSGLDYAGLTGAATIPAGAVLTYFDAVPIDDGLVEGYESIHLRLKPAPHYVIGLRAEATGEIIENDGGVPPAINREGIGMAAGRLAFKVNGVPGQSFHIFSSTNLQNWVQVTTQPIPAGSDYLEASQDSGAPRRFFRAVLQ